MHPSKTPWSVVRVAMVALNRGDTFMAAGEASGLHVRTVYRLVTEYGRMNIRERKPRPGSLSCAEREDIFAGIVARENDAKIGRRLGRHRATIGREIANNGGRDHYRPHLAEQRACEQACRAQKPWFEDRVWLWEIVQGLLRELWSPEQISGWLSDEHRDDPDWHVSHESIYQAIYVQAKGELKAELVKCLRTRRPRRKPRSRAAKANSGRIKDMVPISLRPPEVEDRAVPGHWEGDLIVGAGGRSAIATVVERSTRFGFMVQLDSKHAAHVARRIAQQAANLPEVLLKSITWDQGTEMADHARFTMATGIDVYFCDPHSPWQRGTNENWNGLARQYFPKGTDLSIHTQADLDAAAHSLNTRPRKTLNWKTPALRFEQLVAATP